jgi:hypothetical protein
MSERVLSYDYALDTSRESAQPDWVIQQALLNELQAVMGSDNFAAVFGSDPSTPLWLRLTPALSPNWDTVGHDLLTNPVGSFEALINNLPLAASDIDSPIELAVVQTVLDVLDPLQLGSTLDEALVDPNTSITAGLLNAADDLATAVLTANDNFPTQLSDLAALEWQNMSELVSATPSAGLADFIALLNPADFFAGL